MHNQTIPPTPPLIRAARYFLNWTQGELGRRCDLSKVSIVAIEKGAQCPHYEKLKLITKIFDDEGIVFNREGGFRVQTHSEKGYYKAVECLKKIRLEHTGSNGELYSCSRDADECLKDLGE